MTKTKIHLQPELLALLSDVRDFVSADVDLAYVTGGFVRDAITGEDPGDIDLAIDADPIALGPRLAGRIGGTQFVLDEDRRHVRVLVPERDLHIDLLPLRGSIEEDLRLRDYTVDAMAITLDEVADRAVEIVDPLGALDDLASKTLRCVSEQALKADPLRLLRGPRIAMERAFTIEPQTEEMIRRNAASLTKSAVERQREELLRVLMTDRAADGLRMLDSLGLLSVLIPEAEVMRNVEQPKEHQWDVFGHALACVGMLDSLLAVEEPDNADDGKLWNVLWGALEWWGGGRRPYLAEEIASGAPRSAVIKLCGFLHDIGKPETKAFDENGRMRFFGHSAAGAELAAAALRRLRFSTSEIDFVSKMIGAHLRPVQMAQQGPPTDRAIFRFFRATGDAGIATLFLSLADHLATVGPRLNWDGWGQHVALVDYILRKRVLDAAVVSPPKLLRGDDLIDALGIESGPLVGELLARIEEAQAAGDVTTREQAIALAREEAQRIAG